MNWGTKIVLGMVVFMLFIIAMVTYMFTRQHADSLVDDDYYERGLHYDEQLKAENNVSADSALVLLEVERSKIDIRLRDSASYELMLMRPSNKKYDVLQKGQTKGSENLIVLETGSLAGGIWLFNLKWTVNGKPYFYQKNLTL